MKLSGIDSIWRTRGELALEDDLSAREALDRLALLFDPGEVVVDRDAGTLSYRKANPAAQDRLATFSNGRLAVADAAAGRMLRYDAGSPALMLTFLAPFLFAALALGMVGLGKLALERAAAEERAAAKTERKDAKKDQAKDKPKELHWIDKALGAPAPKKPEDKKSEAEKKKKAQEKIREDHSPRRAYGIAVLFALIWLVGRWLEPRLFRATLARTLAGAPADSTQRALTPERAGR